jgi:hypothetical protein
MVNFGVHGDGLSLGWCACHHTFHGGVADQTGVEIPQRDRGQPCGCPV